MFAFPDDHGREPQRGSERFERRPATYIGSETLLLPSYHRHLRNIGKKRITVVSVDHSTEVDISRQTPSFCLFCFDCRYALGARNRGVQIQSPRLLHTRRSRPWLRKRLWAGFELFPGLAVSTSVRRTGRCWADSGSFVGRREPVACSVVLRLHGTSMRNANRKASSDRDLFGGSGTLWMAEGRRLDPP